MKMKKMLLVLASATMASTLLAACQGDGDGGSTGSGTYDYGAIAKISGTNLAYVAIDQEVDLDDYYQVELDDDTTSKNYGIVSTISEENLSISGHKITAHAIGDWEIQLVCDGFSTYVTIHCKSDMNIQWIELLDKLEDAGGNNYTIEIGEYNALTGEWDYDFTYLHNSEYVAMYDKNDRPGDEDNSAILAQLTDGYSYWGYFDENDKPTFQNGKCNFNSYYISLPLSGVSGSSFSSDIDEDTGVETLYGNATQEQNFLNYSFSSFPTSYGYSYDSLIVDSLADEDEDGTIDTAYLSAWVVNDETQQTVLWTDIRLSDIGTSTIDVLETAIKDSSYVPVKLDVTPIKNAFAKATANKNYTVTQEFYPCDSSGEQLEPDSFSTTDSVICYMLGTTEKIENKFTVTSTGVNFTFTRGDETVYKLGYWNEDGKSYEGLWQAGEDGADPTITKTEIDGVTDVFSNSSILSLTASAVTDTGIENTDWSSKAASEDGTYTYSGNVGDNTVSDGQTNLFYQQLFDQNPFIIFNLSDGSGSMGFGTFLTMDGGVEMTDGSTCSYSYASSYESATFDPSTGEVSINVLIYLGFTNFSQRYYMTTYTISAIDETTNDFSGYVNTATDDTESSEA